jgi:C-terminal processing protease CtpA/Prc
MQSLGLSYILLCFVLSAQERPRPVKSDLVRETVESLAKHVGKEYFDAETAEKVGQRLKEGLAHGRYDDVPSLPALAKRLTRDMFEVTKDNHLSVFVARQSDLEDDSHKKPAVSREEQGRKVNFGVKRVEVLAGNVGYLNLTHFYRPEEAGDTLAAAMCLLRNADALIIDMRENTGGSPETVAQLASYLFAEPKLALFKIISRHSDSQQYSTADKPPPGHNGSRPVFVLTSARTFSAGEGLAFILQEHKRATIVGETTSGAANPGRSFAITDSFEAVIPTGRVATAVRESNWEGVGVKPDVHSPAAKALDAAHALATRALQDQ